MWFKPQSMDEKQMGWLIGNALTFGSSSPSIIPISLVGAKAITRWGSEEFSSFPCPSCPACPSPNVKSISSDTPPSAGGDLATTITAVNFSPHATRLQRTGVDAFGPSLATALGMGHELCVPP
jgi:hypothetical protein